jgi:glycosyltransferase involved in cell wall biosynthesis
VFSVCIPVYRYDVRALVQELLRQAAGLSPTPEIIVFDDASPKGEDYGREDLRNTAGITYRELDNNLGRAGIRNAMVQVATRPWVLLMDADGWPAASFLETYQATLQGLPAKEASSVIVGGRTYRPSPPEDRVYHLHWHYGLQRESRPLSRRIQEGWLGFQSNNFLAPATLLKRYPFLEDHTGYGHEDTYWGQLLHREGVKVLHIDNPVVHLGLEPSSVFLDKQREAVKNLRTLRQQYPWIRTRLTELVDKWPWVSVLPRLVPDAWLQRYLAETKTPSLWGLDLLKLSWWYARPEID